VSADEFSFEAMQDQGNAAGVPTLYVFVMTPLPVDPEAAAAARSQQPSPLEVHYAYMHRVIAEGKVLFMGPCMEEPKVPGQAPVPPGFGVLRVDSRAEAEEIAHNEPFHVMGWRHNAVLSWTPKFGRLIEMLAQNA
jgi:uncharacterized protein YciI